MSSAPTAIGAGRIVEVASFARWCLPIRRAVNRTGTRQAILLVALAAVGLAGCGGSDTESGEVASNSAPLVNWPLFGRVPERTHYLPDEGRDLDPPLREAWSINTHALIEFPPALAGGVAYVANKYGDVRAVRLRDHKMLWERVTDQRLSGPPTFVTAPVYHQGRVFLAFLDGDLVAVDAATGKTAWKRNLHAHLESSPLVVGGDLYLGDDRTNLRLAARLRRQGPLAVQLTRRDQSEPELPRRPGLRRRLPGARCSASTPTSGKLLWRTNTSKVPPFGDGRLLLLTGRRLRPRLRGARRRHRLRLRRKDRQGRLVLSRPTTSSTARPRSPTSPAPRPASTSAATTSTSTRSTHAAAGSAGATTSAGRCREPRS